MAAMLDSVKSFFEGKVDFQGQRLADRINQEILVMGALLSLILGFALQSLSTMMLLFAAISAVDFVLVVPAWPWYRRHRTKWLPAVPASTAAGQGEGDDEEDADHDKKE